MKTNTMRGRLHFIEELLGTSSGDPDIYRTFIGQNAPDAATLEEEVEAIGTDGVIEKTMTVFPRDENGNPFFYDYWVKGFFKDTCGGLRRVFSSHSAKIKAFKKEIDKLIFPEPRKILIHMNGDMGTCQRPLRASTPQGDRVALAMSEAVPAGSWAEFTVRYFSPTHEALLREWFDYGIYSGLGQWRNSGKGRFLWEELDDEGNRIGGNYED